MAIYPAGGAPAGFGQSGIAFSPAPAQAPEALAFDVSTRSFALTVDGGLSGMNEVDQRVVLALGVEKGTLASVPTQGIDLTQLRRATPTQVQGLAELAVRTALGTILSRGDITIVSIVGERRGRPIYIDVSYTNLRSGRNGAASIKT